jgi:hypothetical protein
LASEGEGGEGLGVLWIRSSIHPLTSKCRLRVQPSLRVAMGRRRM